MAEANGNGNGGHKRWKEQAVNILWMGSALAAISTLHTVIVLPRTMEASRQIAREEIGARMDLHERQVDDRMSILHHRLDSLATQEGLRAVSSRLESIEERLRHLERSGK